MEATLVCPAIAIIKELVDVKTPSINVLMVTLLEHYNTRYV